MLIRLPLIEVYHDSHATRLYVGTERRGLTLGIQRRSYQDDLPYWAIGLQRRFTRNGVTGWRTISHATLSRRP